MLTTLISSHGSHCISNKGASIIKLPSNVIVLMNCENALTWSDPFYDSAFWAFATDSKLHLALKKKKLDVNAFAKFLKALEPLNSVAGSHTNNFCIFADKCPDLIFSYEHKNFRSGIFRLPSKVVVKNKSRRTDFVVSHKMFERFAQKDTTQPATEQHYVNAWLHNNNLTQLQSDEKFSVKHRQNFPSENYEDNRLSKFIKDISEKEPDKMHFIIAFTCRARQKTTMKLQQYSVTEHPYQAAIVMYDKVSKFLKN